MSIKRNTAYNLFGAIVPLAVSLITVPIYIGKIGEARYGVLAVAWLLLGYFGLFDLGLGRATAQHIAALREGPLQKCAQIFWTALALNAVIGIIGGLLLWPIAVYFFGHVFNADEVLRLEMRTAIPWLILAVPMATTSGVLTGVLQGLEKFFELNFISVNGTILFQIFPLAITFIWGKDIGYLIPGALLANLITFILLFLRCSKYIKINTRISFDKILAKKLLRFGGWVTITSFISPIMILFDRFLIGILVSLESVTYYTVPFQLAKRTSVFSSSLSAALFPRFASLSTREAAKLTVNAIQSLIAVMTPIVGLCIVFVEVFLSWWIGEGFALQSYRVGQILLIGFWVNGLARIPFSVLQAQGRPDLVAKAHIFEIAPYLLTLFISLKIFGTTGAAVVFSLRVLLDFLLLAKFSKILNGVIFLLFVPMLFFATAFVLSIYFKPGSSEWFLSVFIYALLSFAWAVIIAPKKLKDFLLLRVKSLCSFFAKN